MKTIRSHKEQDHAGRGDQGADDPDPLADSIVEDQQGDARAAKIERGIAKAEVKEAAGEKEKPEPPEFTPYKPPRRRPGTGCVSRLNDHLWEGRYSPVWPDGKKHARNVYAKTEAECEGKLKVLIQEMKKEIAQAREKAKLD